MPLVQNIEAFESGRSAPLAGKAQKAIAQVMRLGAVGAGAGLASAATVKLGNADHGYAIGGYVPLSLALAAALKSAAFFELAGKGSALNPLLSGMGDGAFAAYAAGVGRLLGQGQFNFMGIGGAADQAQQYAKLLELRDQHARASR